MKKVKIFTMFLLIGIFFTMGSDLYAQDPTKVSSNVYKKIILDNEHVRVIQVVFAPGVSTAWHSHPDHVVYCLTSGKIEITDKDKKPQVFDIKANSAMYMPAVTHMAKNVGKTTLKLIITELKPM